MTLSRHHAASQSDLISRARGFCRKRSSYDALRKEKLCNQFSINHINQLSSYIFLSSIFLGRERGWETLAASEYERRLLRGKPPVLVRTTFYSTGAATFSPLWPGFVERMRRIATQAERYVSCELPAFQVGICSIP